MNRLARVAMVGALVAGSCSLALPAEAAAGCKAVREDFPNGVARSTQRAEATFNSLYMRPTVNRAAYLRNIQLDSRGTGVICRVRPEEKPPPAVRGLTITPLRSPADGTPSLLVQWNAVRAWPDPVTYVVLLNGKALEGDLNLTIGGGAYSLMLADLAPATTYEVNIVARNDAGDSVPVRSTGVTP